MKMRRTCRFFAPIETSTAMSRVFSITIMMSEIRMLSAATKTIRPMVMKVTSAPVAERETKRGFAPSSWSP